MSGLTAHEATALIDNVKRWREKPDEFAVEQFSTPGEPLKLDPVQYSLFAALASDAPEHQRIAMQAAAGTAKTAGLAMSSLWFMVCCGDRDWRPQGRAISVSEKNLRDNYVKELAMWRARSPLCMKLLDLNTEKLALRGEEERGFIAFRSYSQGASDDEAGNTLSGLHGRYTLQIIDEAGSQPPAIGRKAEQAREAGSVFCKVLVAGNPDSNDGLLHEIATALRDQWTLFEITGDPDDPQRSPRYPLEKARKEIETYGRDNAWVRIYTLGKFPLTALNKFLGPDDISRAQRRNLHEEDFDWCQNRLGIDPARFGDDRTGFVRRQGRMMWASRHIRGCNTGEIAGIASVMNMESPFDVVAIDMGGENSGGVFDQLKMSGLPVVGVYSSGKAPDPKFFNMRAYMHYQAAQWVKTGGQLPQDAALAKEAMAAIFDYKNGKLYVEPKADIKKRLGGDSPDLWDSAQLTFWTPDQPKMAAGAGRFGVGGLGFAQTDEGDPLGRG
jgi:hypothetical protein